jgi:putative membrane protein
MNSFIIRLILNAVGLWVTTLLPIGIRIGSENYLVTLLVVALIFGIVNALVKPVLTILTLPLTIITLGIFLLVINALMLLLTDFIARAVGLNFRVEGFVAALLGSIVISIVSFILARVLPDRL